MKWRPIETLEPTDEPLPPVLLYNPRHAADPDFPGLALSTSNRVFASHHGKRNGYTHWQPLPEPPK
jgi:hypothetical protein